MKQSGLFGLSDHLKRLSPNGDPLEVLSILRVFARSSTLHWPIRMARRVVVRPMTRWRCSRS
jgi:hypothetical protein